MRALVAAVAAGLVLSACAGTQPVRPLDTAPTTPATVTHLDLTQQRRAAGIADCPQVSHAPAAAHGLPDVTINCLGGGPQVPLARLRGPLVVHVWASWCGPCRAEARYVAAAAAARPQVAFLGINYQDPDPAAAISFAGEVGWTWPQLADPDRSLAGPLGIVGPPLTLLVDANGTIVARHVGQFTSSDQLVALIDAHLR